MQHICINIHSFYCTIFYLLLCLLSSWEVRVGSILLLFTNVSSSLRPGYQRQSSAGLPATLHSRYPRSRIHSSQVLDVYVRWSVSVSSGVFHPVSRLDTGACRFVEWQNYRVVGGFRYNRVGVRYSSGEYICRNQYKLVSVSADAQRGRGFLPVLFCLLIFLVFSWTVITWLINFGSTMAMMLWITIFSFFPSADFVNEVIILFGELTFWTTVLFAAGVALGQFNVHSCFFLY